MPDREKVIKGLEYCMGGCQVSCFKCPYRDQEEVPPDCLDNCRILQDAVELLKEQEPVKPIERLYGTNWVFYECECNKPLYERSSNYCPWCGRRLKWDAID